ncbi:hypothetical protein BCR43DRAFT_497896 [Syncephalastrum racemosum]|uniref:C2H2-type domain-containing protein n=1 Tax=Syncephalastrum racemosum TaxID=13706 RepID=A0A1X2H306_SYNRA|nr:hypothetical protein BCR43DRAFT_497896 [Syncephalastrum racemosum]
MNTDSDMTSSLYLFSPSYQDYEFCSFSELHQKPLDPANFTDLTSDPLASFTVASPPPPPQQQQQQQQNLQSNQEHDLFYFTSHFYPSPLMDDAPGLTQLTSTPTSFSSPSSVHTTTVRTPSEPDLTMFHAPPHHTIFYESAYELFPPQQSSPHEQLPVPTDSPSASSQASSQGPQQLEPTKDKPIKKASKKKGTRRKTADQLPYAPNLLNLNLAPVRRQHTRPSHKANSAAKTISPFKCDFPGCQKTFTRPYNLKSHRRTHTAERPFECTYCPKRFARQHDRNRHSKLHFGIKPYVCHLCNKAFARQDALNRHQRPDMEHGDITSCVTLGSKSRAAKKSKK